MAELCLPHFEQEEQAVFPVFGLLDDPVVGEVRAEMVEILPLISAFKTRQDAMERQHHSITSAIAGLMQAAYRERNREYAEFAYCLTVHEKIEDEVIYPIVILIGKYVSEKLGIQ